jgi:hypothetical protein
MPGKKQPTPMPKKREQKRERRAAAQRGSGQVREGHQRAVQKIRIDKDLGSIKAPAVRALAEQMAIPFTSIPMRVPTTDMPYTSVMKLRSQFTYTHNSAGIVGLDAGDALYALYGQPGRLLEYGPEIPAANGEYNLTMGASQFWVLENTGIAGNIFSSDEWPLTSCSFVAGTGTPYKGEVQPIGMSKGANFLFLSGRDSVFIAGALGTSTIVGKFLFEVWRWTGRGQEAKLLTTVEVAASGGIPTTGATLIDAGSPPFTTGYYLIKFTGVTVTSGSSTSSIMIQLRTKLAATGAGMVIQVPAPELITDTALTSAIRRTSASLLITNTSAFNNRQGGVIGARANDVNWGGQENVAPLSMTFIESLSNKYSGDASNGCYTFMEFTGHDEIFQEVGCVHAKSITYDLDCPDLVNLVLVNNASHATAPNSYIVSLDVVLEFQSQSQRYMKTTPPASLTHGDLIEARRALNIEGQYHFENPAHLQDVLSLIKRGWNAVRDNAMPVATYAARLAPTQYRPLIYGAGYAMSRR